MALPTAVFNFCSGPAMLPSAVMQKAQSEFMDYQGIGISILEMSHRSDAFLSVLESAEQRFRQLLAIPSNYKILFTQGGASLQFSAVPLNLLGAKQRAGYLDTGYWSVMAINEAKKFGQVSILHSTQTEQYRCAPCQKDYVIPQDLAYVHYTPNETIDGVAFDYIPDTGSVPLVADMSSCILSKTLDVSKFGVIYAGAQKNIGPAGLTIVIVREDLLGRQRSKLPRVLSYQELSKQKSMANTPPTYSIYLADLVFQWLKEQGGVEAIEQINQHKARMLYNTIDDSKLFFNNVKKSSRSIMNVPIFLNEELIDVFVSSAEQSGLLNLKGHRSRGGLRASIYNAMPMGGVTSLIEFMKEFEKNHVR